MLLLWIPCLHFHCHADLRPQLSLMGLPMARWFRRKHLNLFYRLLSTTGWQLMAVDLCTEAAPLIWPWRVLEISNIHSKQKSQVLLCLIGPWVMVTSLVEWTRLEDGRQWCLRAVDVGSMCLTVRIFLSDVFAKNVSTANEALIIKWIWWSAR